MEKSIEKVWRDALGVIRDGLNLQSFEMWFSPLKGVSLDEERIVLEAPNKFFREWLLDHYMELLRQAVSKSCGKDLAVEIVAADAASNAAWENKPARKTERAKSAHAEGDKDRPDSFAASLNQKFKFDNFVVGPSNRFAHAASLAVASSPAKTYNPFFIYGGVGLGKTHLMQAIGHHLLGGANQAKVCYISSERFTNQLINAIQNRSTPKFRQLYRGVDILLIDDIHFIAGKESTQEEFFNTFNTLFDAHKQIVLSSDRPPKEIGGLEKRLVSRFEWGLVTDIQPPDLETRIAILRKKIQMQGVSVPDDVTSFIAGNIKSNIRELEGALMRVVAYSTLIGTIISMEMARDVLKDMLTEELGRVGIELIQKRVGEYFDVRLSDMKTKRRNKTIAYPRQIAMYLARNMTDYSFPEIGEYFGGRDHTTVLHAYNKIKNELTSNQATKDVVSKIILNIRAQSC